MNIKEAEERTGLKAANIRYYEQEGLLHPERNRRNNKGGVQEGEDERK